MALEILAQKLAGGIAIALRLGKAGQSRERFGVVRRPREITAERFEARSGAAECFGVGIEPAAEIARGFGVDIVTDQLIETRPRLVDVALPFGEERQFVESLIAVWAGPAAGNFTEE